MEQYLAVGELAYKLNHWVSLKWVDIAYLKMWPAHFGKKEAAEIQEFTADEASRLTVQCTATRNAWACVYF